jgi:hypothetical protein
MTIQRLASSRRGRPTEKNYRGSMKVLGPATNASPNAEFTGTPRPVATSIGARGGLMVMDKHPAKKEPTAIEV